MRHSSFGGASGLMREVIAAKTKLGKTPEHC
jgi:hypothetical protein